MTDQGDRPSGLRTPPQEAPYDGTLGRTRTAAVHVWMPDGSVRSLSVYVGIDATRDPALAALARGGTLHHVAEGVELAVPYTYHDRVARVFVLVVPETLRHRALELRAEHMALVAADAAHAVPSYVRELELVVGARGLVTRLEQGAAGALPQPAAAPSDARALTDRERDLSRRERLVAARERAFELRALRKPARGVAEVLDEESDDDAGAVLDSEIEELSEDEDAADDEVEEVEDLSDEDEELLSDDAEVEDFAEAVDIDGEGSAVRAVVLEDATVLAGDEAIDADVPAWFAADPEAQLCLDLRDGRVVLVVRAPVPAPDADVDFLVQLDPAAPVPVVLTTFVVTEDGEHKVLRSALDPDDDAELAALRALADTFEVELVAWDDEERISTPWGTLRAACESNVRAVLAELARRPVLHRATWEAAAQAMLQNPPPWHDDEHPFQGDVKEPPRTATEAAVLLDEIAEWVTTPRRDVLRLLLCVADEVVDAGTREGIAFALDFGLSLTPALAARAIELGIERDEPSLLLRRITGLCRTTREKDFAGLEESVVRTLWTEAIEQAARLGVTLSDDTRELAKAHAGERALVHAAALSESHDTALEPVRKRALGAPHDVAALDELAARGAYRDVLAVCRVTAELDAERAARVFARVARRGDPVALDALLSLVSLSEEPRVRVGAALALATRHAASAIDELASHVARDGEPEWRFFALALGRYGAGSFRAISRALGAAQVPDARCEEVQAHLALHGARAQVRARSRSHDAAEARMAERSLTRASELKNEKTSGEGLEQQGPLTLFCQMFDRYFLDAPG